MGTALGNVLPLAVAAAIRPGSIIAIVLVLTTPRARSNGLMFAIGFMASLAVLGVALLVIAESIGADDDSGEPADWASAAKIVVGVVFLILAGRTWWARPAQGEGVPKRWLAVIDGVTPHKALGFGALIGAANGKNFLLTVAATVTIAQTGIPLIEQFVPLVVYVAIAGLCVLAPVVLYFVLGTRAAHMLVGLRDWLLAHGAAIMGILFLVIGFSLIGHGIRELS